MCRLLRESDPRPHWHQSLYRRYCCQHYILAGRRLVGGRAGTDATSPGDAASISRRGAAAGSVGAAQWRWLRACTGSHCPCAADGGTASGSVSFFRNSLPLVAEQVIEVPKLALLDGFLLRSFPLEPQLAEQLLEVPTEPAYVEQIVDNPVPRGRHGRLPSLSQDRDQQHLWLRRLPTFPLPVEVFKVYAQDRVQQRLPSRTFPLQLHVVEVLVVVFTVFLRFRAPQRLFPVLSETLVKGFFALYPGSKKV